MRLYHRTTMVNAALILREGFVDRSDRYTSDFGVQGVWFSDQPKVPDECDAGEAVVLVDFDARTRFLSSFEWTEDETDDYKEWLIPAELVNARMTRKRIC
jgi:hypothetical protein